MIYTVGFAFVFASVYLIWQATHGGVVSHHLLDDRTLPSISNWWGIAILPAVAALASWSVKRRAEADATELPRAAGAFIGSLLVGVALSIAFVIDSKGNATSYIFLGAILSGLVLPVYRPEYAFGFAIGMSVVFGLVLPPIAALIPAAISATFHFLIWPAVAWTVRAARSRI